MLGTSWGLSALWGLWVQLVGSRSWGVGGLVSPGCPETCPVQKNMKDCKCAAWPGGVKFVRIGVFGRGECACAVVAVGFAE